jgi:hypothetical protein
MATFRAMIFHELKIANNIVTVIPITPRRLEQDHFIYGIHHTPPFLRSRGTIVDSDIQKLSRVSGSS